MAIVYITSFSVPFFNLHFLPFNYGQQRCLIIFEDKEYGKFSYSEVVGDASLPEPTAPVKFSCVE